MRFLCVKKTFKAIVCQIYGYYFKTKSEIMKQYKKDHIIFFLLIPNHRFWDFKPLLDKSRIRETPSLS